MGEFRSACPPVSGGQQRRRVPSTSLPPGGGAGGVVTAARPDDAQWFEVAVEENRPARAHGTYTSETATAGAGPAGGSPLEKGDSASATSDYVANNMVAPGGQREQHGSTHANRKDPAAITSASSGRFRSAGPVADAGPKESAVAATVSRHLHRSDKAVVCIGVVREHPMRGPGATSCGAMPLADRQKSAVYFWVSP